MDKRTIYGCLFLFFTLLLYACVITTIGYCIVVLFISNQMQWDARVTGIFICSLILTVLFGKAWYLTFEEMKE